MNKDNYLHSLVLLHEKIIDLLDTFFNTPVLVKDEQMNKSFIELQNRIDEIENKIDIEETSYPLYNSLIGDIEELDIDWEYDRRTAQDYLAYLKRELDTKEKIKTDKTTNQIISNANYAINNFKELTNKKLNYDREPQISPPRNKNEDEIYQWDGLTINVTQGTAKYLNNKAIEISTESNQIKFILQLFKKDRVVQYKEIAKELEINSYHPDYTNKDLSRDIQIIRRDALKKLKPTGIPHNKLKKMIKNKQNLGYRLNRNPSK